MEAKTRLNQCGSRTRAWAMIGLSVMFAGGLSGCKSDNPISTPTPSPSPSPSPSTTSGPVGTVSAAGFYVTPILPSGINYYFHEQSSLTSPCVVSSTETDLAKKDIYCILDMQEMDLYFNGLTFNFNAPNSMCSYTQLRSYAFYQFNAGTGNVDIISEVDTAADGSTSQPVGSAPVANGVPVCPYDYTAKGGPNCCEGSWTLTETTASPATVTVTTGAYSGLRSNCLAGAAMDVSGALDKDGFPTAVDFRTLDTGQNFIYTIEAPIAKGYGSNLYIANYFLPTSFGDSGTTFPPSTSSDFPIPMYTNHQYYEYGCLDAADDYNARVRLLIRSWDTVANFTAYSNPYTSPATLEPEFLSPYHDKDVWQDYAPTGYPGFSL